jgi:hypothetical protein
MNDVEYYRLVKPADPRPPINFQQYAVEYRNFVIERAHSEYMLWQIKTLELDLPPPSLRGSYTTAQKCKDHIDRFLEVENETTNNSFPRQ